jgi:hypothetical protein
MLHQPGILPVSEDEIGLGPGEIHIRLGLIHLLFPHNSNFS